MQRNKTRPRNLGDARPNLYKLWEGIYAGSTKALLSISQPYRPGKMLRTWMVLTTKIEDKLVNIPNIYKLWEGMCTKVLLSQPYRPGKLSNKMDGFDNQNRRETGKYMRRRGLSIIIELECSLPITWSH